MSRELVRPSREPIPVAFYAVVVCLICEHCVMSQRPDVLWVVIMAAVFLSGAFVLWKKHDTLAFAELGIVCLVTAVVALVVSCLAAYAASQGTEELSATSVSTLELEVTSDTVPTRQGYRCRARAIKEGRTLGEVWLVSDEVLLRGTHLRCVGRFAEPGGDRLGDTLKSQGLLGSIRAVRIIDRATAVGPIGLLEGTRQSLLKMICPKESDEQSLIAALSLGWRLDFRERGLSDLFSMCGMSHVAAVSGTHVSIVCALLAAIIGRMRASPRMRIVLLGILTAAFVLMSGAAASSLRAWAMSMCALGSQLEGRRSHALSSLSLCCLAMALAHPRLSGDVGFLLSFICVGSLCLFSRYAAYVIEALLMSVRLPRWVPKQLKRAHAREGFRLAHLLGASLVAALSALPLSAASFGRVSIVGPMANALLSVPVSALVSLSVATSAAGWIPNLQMPLMALTRLLAGALITALRMIARIPGSSFAIDCGLEMPLLIVVAMGIALYLLWPSVNPAYVVRGTALLSLTVLLVFVRWRFFAPARICVLDVGQGDSILVQDGSAAILVDTGPDASAARELARLNVSHLDAVVLTHLHDDHYGGLDDLLGQVACDAVYVGNGAADNLPDELEDAVWDLSGSDARELAYGNRICVGAFTLEVIWPHEPQPGTENEHSLVMTVSFTCNDFGLQALLTGDAEDSVLDECIRAGDVGDIDLLKLGHHGSEVSVTEGDVRILLPELAIASAGWNNSYGHPSETCVNILEDAGAIVLCTKDVGTIVVEPAAGVMHVHETGASHEVE